VNFNLIAQKSINFTQQFTFEYQANGNRKEFSVFADPKTATWLLTRDETFGGQPEDIDFWILRPDGGIIIIGNDTSGKKQRILLKNNAFSFGTSTLKAKSLGKNTTFGANKYGWQVLKATEYVVNSGRLTENVYATQLPYSCRALLAYNSCVDVENHLPIFNNVEYYRVFTEKFLVLQDSKFRLVSVSPTEYSVDF
jgi:hypothetical protein